MLPGALVQSKELAGLNVCIHVLLAVENIIPQTRSVPLVSDSASGERDQIHAHVHTHTYRKPHTYGHTNMHSSKRTHTHTLIHTGRLQVSPDMEIRWQGGHRNCKLDETQYFPNNKKN